MKRILILSCALAGFAAAPAVADNGQVMIPPAWVTGPPKAPQCFSGAAIRGVTRAADRAVFVQTGSGSIWRVELAGDCAALNVAKSVSMRAWGAYQICAGGRAEVVARTPGGERRCRADDVRQAVPDEISTLAGRR